MQCKIQLKGKKCKEKEDNSLYRMDCSELDLFIEWLEKTAGKIYLIEEMCTNEYNLESYIDIILEKGVPDFATYKKEHGSKDE